MAEILRPNKQKKNVKEYLQTSCELSPNSDKLDSTQFNKYLIIAYFILDTELDTEI